MDDPFYDQLKKYLMEKKILIKGVFDDPTFVNIEGIETYSGGCDIHLLDSVETIFNHPDKIDISYWTDNAVTAALILECRIGDPYFGWSKIVIKNNEFHAKDFIETDLLFTTEFFDLIMNSNIITIYSKALKDFKYAKQVLIYKVIADKEGDYFLKQELNRWKSYPTF